jgi:hypothetical protein
MANVEKILQLREARKTVKEIAAATNCSIDIVNYALAKARKAGDPRAALRPNPMEKSERVLELWAGGSKLKDIAEALGHKSHGYATNVLTDARGRGDARAAYRR